MSRPAASTEKPDPSASPPAKKPLQWALEIGAIFLLFAVQGAWPVPDVNEPYYLGKAIHFWNPDFAAGDFFLQTDDTHWVFYLTFGWLSLLMPPLALAWVGRIVTWALLAWSWRRLSLAFLPRPWWSVASAALLGLLTEHCHLAGEWIIGGVEAKGFAFVFLFLGLEAVVRERWNRGLVFMGLASLFHVLVGGWAAVAVGFVWFASPKERPRLWSLWPGILFGFLLALPSLVSGLELTRGVDPAIVAKANQFYVYERLPHHLCLFPPWFVFRFVAVSLLWGILAVVTPSDRQRRLLARFVLGSLLLAGVGLVLSLSIPLNPSGMARLLRFYWFRLSDVAVPMGLAIQIPAFVIWVKTAQPRAARVAFWLMIILCATHFGSFAVLRAVPRVPRAVRVPAYGPWRLACRWIAESGEIPPDARFLTPRLSQTFKWYAGRPEVVTWKDLPQDAESIVEWRARIDDIHATGLKEYWCRWYANPAELGTERLRRLGEKYDADYVITRKSKWIDLEPVYENSYYAIYRLK